MGRDRGENKNFDKKSLKILDLNSDEQISSKAARELAKDCVCFANGGGGIIEIGIEDKDATPPADRIFTDRELPQKLTKKISNLTQNVFVRAEIKKYPNGGEVVEIRISPSELTIASTNDGRYYIRISDTCVPILPDELSRLFNDKPSFIWEKKVTKNPKERIDEDKLRNLVLDLRNSVKVSPHVKEKSDEEILEHYFLTEGDFLTNLGTLWIGSRNDRSRLSYSPTIHFIKYDERDQKIRKDTWDEYYLNPKELVEAILQIPEWNEGVEIPDGMFRKFIPHYPKDTVIRELLINAIVHRPYTQRGEIVIKLFPDRLEITNPGLFPVGVTPENFLHKSVRRNEGLAKVFSDLKMMEQEGSGIDKVYEVLLTNGKSIPVALQNDDSVTIIIEKRIISTDAIKLIEHANKDFQLKSRELISLGVIAENNSLSAVEFSNKLGLSNQTNVTKQWLGNLLDLGLIKSNGKTKSLQYFVNPDLLKKSNFKGKTNLRRIENHRLKELIFQDVRIYQPAGLGDINQRIGREISYNKVRKTIYNMVEDGLLLKEGNTNGAKYSISPNSSK